MHSFRIIDGWYLAIITLFKKKSFSIELDPFFIFLLPAVFISGYVYDYLIAVTSVLLHELGHVFPAGLNGMKVRMLRLLPIGMNAVIEEGFCDNWKRIFVYSCGPLINLLIAAVSFLIYIYCQLEINNIRFIIQTNLFLALFNMLPILPLDGGKILRELLSIQLGILSSNRWVKNISLILSFTLIALGVLLTSGNALNFSLVIIGLYILFAMNSEEMEAAVMNIKHLVYRRSRILKKGVYPVRDLVVVKSVRLCEIVKCLDFDRFHFVHVLDEEMKLLRVFTEQEIIDGMVKYNSELTFEEFIRVLETEIQ